MLDEPSVNSSGILGRVLTWIGFAWFLLIVTPGLRFLAESGLSSEIVDFLQGGFFPALILIAVGRALRRRARQREAPEEPKEERPARRPQPRPEPPRTEPAERQEPSPPAPEHPQIAPRLEEVLGDMEADSEPGEEPASPLPPASDELFRPQTSKEMLEEARRKLRSRP